MEGVDYSTAAGPTVASVSAVDRDLERASRDAQTEFDSTYAMILQSLRESLRALIVYAVAMRRDGVTVW